MYVVSNFGPQVHWPWRSADFLHWRMRTLDSVSVSNVES
jgi:hypothetical protein